MPNSESQLTSLLQAAENEQVDVNSYSAFLWLGMTDSQVEDQWVWDDGLPVTWMVWGQGQPDNEDEHCVVIMVKEYWDVPCDWLSNKRGAFFCQGNYICILSSWYCNLVTIFFLL